MLIILRGWGMTILLKVMCVAPAQSVLAHHSWRGREAPSSALGQLGGNQHQKEAQCPQVRALLGPSVDTLVFWAV